MRPMDLFPAEYRDFVCCVRPVVDESFYPVDGQGTAALQAFLRLSPAFRQPSLDEVLTISLKFYSWYGIREYKYNTWKCWTIQANL